MTIKQIIDENDIEEMYRKSNSSLCVIDVFTDWCGPCKRIAPQFEKLSQENKNIHFYKMNGESDVGNEFNIEAFPSFIFIKNRKVVEIFVGANIDSIKERCSKYS